MAAGGGAEAFLGDPLGFGRGGGCKAL